MITLPRWIPTPIRHALIVAWNLYIFVTSAISVGVPFRLWRKGWNKLKADHEASVRKAIFEARMDGEIRQDEDGRLWYIGDD